MLGKEKGAAEDEVVGWHHWLKGHEFDQTSGDSERQGGLVCLSPKGVAKSQRWLSDWTRTNILACSTVGFIRLAGSSPVLMCFSHLRCGNAPLDHLPLNRLTTMRKRFRSVGLSAFIFIFKNIYSGIFSCSMWDLVSWPRIESRPPALRAQSTSPWTTRKVPVGMMDVSGLCQ